MKKTLLAVLALLLVPAMVLAQEVTLGTPEVLSVPTAVKMKLHSINFNISDKNITVVYYWVDATGKPIQTANSPFYNRTWECRDIETPGTNAECTDVAIPYECCTGVGTGTCDGMDSSCFTDTFLFTIRSQDVGTKLGIGLRNLIWNKMKASVLSAGNTGTFE